MRRRRTMAARDISDSAAHRWMLGVLATAMFAAGCDAHSPTERATSTEPEARPASEPAGARPKRGPEVPDRFRTADLRLPRSTAAVPWNPDEDAPVVVSTVDEIRLGGEHVADLPIDSSYLKEDPFRIVPLRHELQRRLNQSKDESTSDEPKLEFAVDRFTPYRRLGEMIYTAGVAGYFDIRLVVSDRSGERTYEIDVLSPRIPGSAGCSSTRYLGHLNHHRHLAPADSRSNRDGADSTDESPGNASASGSSSTMCKQIWSEVVGHPLPAERNRLNLVVALSTSGIRIGATGAIVPPREGCPKGGPTLCLKDGAVDVAAKLSRARQLLEKGSADSRRQASTLLDQIQSAYDWRRLYETLIEVKSKYPNETVVKIAADPEIPVQLVVRAMDVSRFVLPQRTYDSSDEFQKALRNGRKFMRPAGNTVIPQVLFSDPFVPARPK